MNEEGKLFLGGSRNPDDSFNKPEYLELKFGNRHGLITGATGTGKTVTLQILAESFSKAGVPVFCSDVKGDLSGIAIAGEEKDFRSEEHTSELQSLMHIPYAVFCLKKKK